MDKNDELITSLQKWAEGLTENNKDISKSLDAKLCAFYLEHGRYDLPNEAEVVDVNDPEWETVYRTDVIFKTDYILQVSKTDAKFARILKEVYNTYVRVARGHIEAMEEKLKRYTHDTFYRPGDIIYIDRDKMHMSVVELCRFAEALKKNKFDIDKVTVPVAIYAHVGIYIGNNEVVHFAGQGDLVGKRHIHICSLKDFLNSELTQKKPENIYIMYFPGDGIRPYKLYPDTSKLGFNPAHIDAFEAFDFTDMQCFSAAETVKRAKAMVENASYGEYDFLDNNCEHLAFFCKTGKKFSVQASNLQQVIQNALDALELIKDTPEIVFDKLTEVGNSVIETYKNKKGDHID